MRNLLESALVCIFRTRMRAIERISNMGKRAFATATLMLAMTAIAGAAPMELLGLRTDPAAGGNRAPVCVRPPTTAEMVANPALIQSKEDAQALMDQLLKDAKTRPGTMADWQALIRAMEVLSPQSSTKDIARFLRRQFYDDSLLYLVGIAPADGEPNISPELRRMQDKLSVLRSWQEVQGKQGKLDFAHSLVAIDAYSWQRNPIGRTKGWIFTYFGDAATGVLSAFGADGAGNNNVPDQLGNDLGRTLVRSSASNEAAPLSQLVGSTQTPPQMSRYLGL